MGNSELNYEAPSDFLLRSATEIPHATVDITANLPASEVLGNGCSAAEQVGPQRLELLTETQHSAERLTVLIETRVELLDVQQGLLIHKLQELLGLFGHLEEHIRVYIRIAAPRTTDG